MLNSKRTVVLVTILLLICFSCSTSAMAQTDRGTITGTVSDPDRGCDCRGEGYRHQHGNTRSHRNRHHDKWQLHDSRFAEWNLRCFCRADGIQKAVLTGILVQVGQTARVDAALQIGETSQAVEVTAETVQIQTETSDRGTVVTGRDVLDLPIVGQGEQRNPAFFINLSPGVTSRGTSTPTASGSGRQLNTTVNGSPTGSLEFHLDGAQIGNVGLLSGDFRNLPFPQDAVAEFKIMTLNPPAEFGTSGLGDYRLQLANRDQSVPWFCL